MEELIAGPRNAGPVPRLVLCGEFSAGKSSIVNLLLGCDILPTAVLPSTRRPTCLRYANDLLIEAILEKGQRERISADVVRTPVREDISHFEIGMPNALLRDMEVLDTPGFADPFQDPARTLDVIESADICVWCTLATQAWRESERQTWLSLPARFRTSGVLVVTHVDTLAHSGERQRVRTRLEREAGFFGDIVFLAVPDAMRARRSNGEVVDPELWRESGGRALVAALSRLVASHIKANRDSTGRDSTGSVPVVETSPAAAEVAPSDPATSDQAVAAAPAAALRTAPASSTPGIPSGSPIAEPEVFLAGLAESVPACLAAAWIDLAAREILVVHGKEPGVIAEGEPLGDEITDLFQGASVRRIEALIRKVRGQAADQTHFVQEILIITDGGIGVFLRSKSRADRALVIVSDISANLGMVIATARRLMNSVDVMA